MGLFLIFFFVAFFVNCLTVNIRYLDSGKGVDTNNNCTYSYNPCQTFSHLFQQFDTNSFEIAYVSGGFTIDEKLSFKSSNASLTLQSKDSSVLTFTSKGSFQIETHPFLSIINGFVFQQSTSESSRNSPIVEMMNTGLLQSNKIGPFTFTNTLLETVEIDSCSFTNVKGLDGTATLFSLTTNHVANSNFQNVQNVPIVTLVNEPSFRMENVHITDCSTSRGSLFELSNSKMELIVSSINDNTMLHDAPLVFLNSNSQIKLIDSRIFNNNIFQGSVCVECPGSSSSIELDATSYVDNNYWNGRYDGVLANRICGEDDQDKCKVSGEGSIPCVHGGKWWLILIIPLIIFVCCACMFCGISIFAVFFFMAIYVHVIKGRGTDVKIPLFFNKNNEQKERTDTFGEKDYGSSFSKLNDEDEMEL